MYTIQLADFKGSDRFYGGDTGRMFADAIRKVADAFEQGKPVDESFVIRGGNGRVVAQVSEIRTVQEFVNESRKAESLKDSRQLSDELLGVLSKIEKDSRKGQSGKYFNFQMSDPFALQQRSFENLIEKSRMNVGKGSAEARLLAETFVESSAETRLLAETLADRRVQPVILEQMKFKGLEKLARLPYPKNIEEAGKEAARRLENAAKVFASSPDRVKYISRLKQYMPMAVQATSPVKEIADSVQSIERWYKMYDAEHKDMSTAKAIAQANAVHFANLVVNARHPAFVPSRRTGGAAVLTPVNVCSIDGGKGFSGFNQLLLEGIVKEQGLPVDASGRVYMGSEPQFGERNLNKISEKTVIASPNEDKNVWYSLYPATDARDIVKLPVRPQEGTWKSRGEIAVTDKDTPETYFGKYMAAGRLGMSIVCAEGQLQRLMQETKIRVTDCIKDHNYSGVVELGEKSERVCGEIIRQHVERMRSTAALTKSRNDAGMEI